MKTDSAAIGQIYIDIKPPRREWRVSERRAGTLMLERVDKPTVFRFVEPAALRDTNRYVRKD
jgi:hypothetical protein